MTQQDPAPVSRRDLRDAAPTAPASALPSVAPATAAPPTGPTRRELRLAAAAAERGRGAGASSAQPVLTPTSPAVPVAAAAAVPPLAPVARAVHALPTVPSSTGMAPARSRRDVRAAAATRRSPAQQVLDAAIEVCRPPFTFSLVLPVERLRAALPLDRLPLDRLRLLLHGDRLAPALPVDRLRAGLAVGGRPIAVVALSGALLAAGMTQVQAEQSVYDVTVANARAFAAEHARAARSSRADAARLTAGAAAYAAERRTAALAAAEAAVQTAGAVTQTAAPVLDPTTLTALEQATAELTELVATAPQVDGEDAVTPPAPAVDAVTPPAVADSPASLTAATPWSLEDPAPGAPASRSEVAGRTSIALRQSVEAADGLPALDLEVSERILAAAAEVSQLSAEVQAAADVVIAEAAAQAAAQAAAEAAARAAAAEVARKVEIAASAGNGQIPLDALCEVPFDPEELLRCDAVPALERLNEAYRAEFGRDLDVVSSYRSYSAQVSTKAARGSLAATPGTSNHGLGLAVDFADFGGLGNFSTANYRWMFANSERFGWYHPRIMRPGGGGPQEPWHWEFGTDDD